MTHPFPTIAMPKTSSVAPADPTAKKGIISLMVALLAACVAFQLNASMLSPVLVVMAGELRTSEVTVGLSQTAFFTSTALFGLFLPRLSDIVGRRKILVLMVGVMVLGSILAALAPNITVLIIARMIQGISGAIVPVCLMVACAPRSRMQGNTARSWVS
ncbi:MFS transporter [Arthrobacter psychrolactophilus]